VNLNTDIGFEIHTKSSFENAVNGVIAALKLEGFGVLTRIDVKATLKEKLNEDFRPYVILGACNPPLAHKALSSDGAVGLILPCNVTVEAIPEGGSLIRIANPEMVLHAGNLQENSTLRTVAAQARVRLERVTESLKEV
jgi:uncharacterized protein (DUF302 family)